MSTRRAFWKVIAFLHDETGELTATGYSISQDEQMPAEEFVFSAYETYQRPLSWIGDKAGISFLQLAGTILSGAALPSPLMDHSQIRFRL